MPRISLNGCQYFYQDVGSGPETVLFGHGFLMTHRMWEHPMEALRDRYRCIAVDWRGQGWSEVTKDGYGVISLCEDIVELVDRLDCGPCHYVGLSMGGFVGFRLLLRNPDWLRSAVLLDTQAGADEPAAQRKYEAMLLAARFLGFEVVMDRVLPLFFGPAFLNNPDTRHEVERWKGIIMSNDRVGVYRAGMGIFHRPDALPQLGAAQTPTRLITGADDIPTPVEKARLAQAQIPGAELTIIPAAGHSSVVERPEVVTPHIASFIDAHARAPVG